MRTRTVLVLSGLLLVAMLMVAAQSSGDGASAIESLKSINSAQATYMRNNPDDGYACDLAALGLAKERDGYSYKVVCKQRVKPQSEYRVAAVPAKKGAGKIYCTDQSGIIRSSNDGETKACFAGGEMVK